MMNLKRLPTGFYRHLKCYPKNYGFQDGRGLCLDNSNLRLELTPNRELIVMAMTGGESGRKNSRLNSRVVVWNDETDLGEVFDSSTGYDFTVFVGGKRSPNVSWIEKSRLEGVNIVGLVRIVPDFLVELRSPTNNLNEARTKMEEYLRVRSAIRTIH